MRSLFRHWPAKSSERIADVPFSRSPPQSFTSHRVLMGIQVFLCRIGLLPTRVGLNGGLTLIASSSAALAWISCSACSLRSSLRPFRPVSWRMLAFVYGVAVGEAGVGARAGSDDRQIEDADRGVDFVVAPAYMQLHCFLRRA
jgi:hypothetical protein